MLWLVAQIAVEPALQMCSDGNNTLLDVCDACTIYIAQTLKLFLRTVPSFSSQKRGVKANRHAKHIP